ncbi:unnamed protein product [Phaedon cochleariae]|uniref:TMC domain-containing protein n=1 Tax=Phaedon cochleariae TaxID=80249 RepID=A0A9N9X1G0_PHACE|nr:unnamed protein product [Phaedon cochleariae]
MDVIKCDCKFSASFRTSQVMSGGANRKKASRSQGWEEAGSEFYQESYPIDADIEVLQKDPKHLATLLPSKQNRTAAATIRHRTNDTRTNNRTVRRRTATHSRRDSTVQRRASAAGEVQVSMLPDLSEMRTNEQTSWEEIMQIKTLPLPMREKKEMKAKILNEPNLRLQGYEQFNWKRRKMWGVLESRLRESFNEMELWKGALKHIEGNFGTGVVAFFLFLKWLFLLNTVIFFFLFLFITLPTILLDYERLVNCPYNATCCAEGYFNETLSENNVFLDLIQGTGILERTILFYGFYSNKTLSYSLGLLQMYYNLPLAYLLIIILCFAISLVAIIRSAAKGFRERLIEGEGQFYQYCNLVFGGWDFCIDNEKAARIKHKALYSEIRANLETEKIKEEKQSRTTQEKCRIVFCRFIVNTVVLAILAGCACLIYLVFDFSTNKLAESTSRTQTKELFFEFLPSMTIVSLNIVVPFTFTFLISFEKYTPMTVIKLSLIRMVFLKLSSLIVFYMSLWRKITCNKVDESQCVACDEIPVCWETFVGQQIFKLLLTDFGTQIVITFVINFARSQLARHFDNKIIKFLGEQTFDLPKHALDIVYMQNLCWYGIFYMPMLSFMAAVIFLLMFYVKKFACLVNCKPSSVIYRASRSNSMFMLVLLVAYAFAIIPIAFFFAELTPSKSCGPFRDKGSVWGLIVDLFKRTPEWLQSVIFFLSTAGFAVPCIIVLLLFLYYYTAVNSANKHLVEVLKNQLVLEGHDKQFLLDRLSLFIKQDNQKRARAEQNGGRGDANT